MTEPSILGSLPDHYESHLGAIVRGWSDEKRAHGIQVVSLDGQPRVGVRTFATLGLGRNLLDISGTRKIRQEILTNANDEFSADAVAGLTLSIAEFVLRRGSALNRPGIPGGSIT